MLISLGLTATVPTAIWGYCVGLVGWGSLARGPTAVSAWLLRDASDRALPFVRIVVALLLLWTIFFAIGLVPQFLVTVGTIERLRWRELYGIAFVSSLAGFVSLGSLARPHRRRGARPAA
jgi:hypothetical protein